jgi:hypothetical protein
VEKINGTGSAANFKYLLADCYYELQDYYRAKDMYKSAIKDECTRLKITISDVKANKVKEKNLGMMFSSYAFCCYDSNAELDGDELMILSAKCGNDIAIRYCEIKKLKWQSSGNKLFE